MRSHSGKRTGAAAARLTAALVCLVALSTRPAVAQTYVQPLWLAPRFVPPPQVIWVAPRPTVVTQPVWVLPSQPVTTFYPPATTVVSPEETTVAPPADGHLRVTITEAFLARLIGREDTNAGPVRECIMGADVYGQQFTVTKTTIDCQPCRDKARFVLRLTGTVSEQTVGVTSQASVQSEGSHQFQMEKQIDFDGVKFTTRSPAAWVRPGISFRGASTLASGIPVIGPLATSIALNEAERRRPTAERIASQMLTRKAAPQFNDEVDRQLADTNRQLSQSMPALFQFIGLSPDQQSLSTSGDRLYYELRVPRPPAVLGRLLVDEFEDVSFERLDEPFLPPLNYERATSLLPLPSVVDGQAITIAVHEDLVNHVLHSLPLGGREVPDRLIDQLIVVLMESLDSMSFDLQALDTSEATEAEFATILLADERPLSIRFDDGQAIVTALAGFRPKLTPEVPTQRLEVPFRLSKETGQLTLEPGDVSVTATQPQDTGPLAELARPLIRQQVEQRLQSLTLPSVVNVNLPDAQPTTLTLREVVLDDGWLVITLD